MAMKAPTFLPRGVVVLSQLPAREREEWYDFLLQEGVQFVKSSCRPPGEAAEQGQDEGGGEPAQGVHYVAHVRVVAPFISREHARPPGFRAPGRRSLKRERRSGATGAGEARVVRFGQRAVDLQEYSSVVSLIHETGPDCGKPRLLSWLMRTIEDLFDLRYSEAVAAMQHNAEDEEKQQQAGEPVPPHTLACFPVYVMEHLRTVHGLRRLTEQAMWDLLLNCAVNRCASSPRQRPLLSHHVAVELFARFLQQAYDDDDLLFFLYVRSVVQRVLRMNFKSRWAAEPCHAPAHHHSRHPHHCHNNKGTGGAGSSPVRSHAPPEVYLTHRQCVRVCRAVFGSEHDPYSRHLLRLLEQHIRPPGRHHRHSMSSRAADVRQAGAVGGQRIEVHQFLLLAVESYHGGGQADLEEEEEDPFPVLPPGAHATTARRRAGSSSSSGGGASNANRKPPRQQARQQQKPPVAEEGDESGPLLLDPVHQQSEPELRDRRQPPVSLPYDHHQLQQQETEPEDDGVPPPPPQHAAHAVLLPAPLVPPSPACSSAPDSAPTSRPGLLLSSTSSLAALEYLSALGSDCIASIENRQLAALGFTANPTPTATTSQASQPPPPVEVPLSAEEPALSPATEAGVRDWRPDWSSADMSLLRQRLEQDYVDELMAGLRERTSSALPEEVLLDIESQLSSGLHDRVSQRLSLLQSSHSPLPPAFKTLRGILQAVVGEPSLFLPSSSSSASQASGETTMRGVLQAIMLDPALRKEVEMLLRFLSNLATSATSEQADDDDDDTLLAAQNAAAGRSLNLASFRRKQQQQQQQQSMSGGAAPGYLGSTLSSSIKRQQSRAADGV